MELTQHVFSAPYTARKHCATELSVPSELNALPTSCMHAAPVQDEIKRLARDVYQDDTKKVREMISWRGSLSGAFRSFFRKKKSAKPHSKLQRAVLSPWRRRSCGSWMLAPGRTWLARFAKGHRNSLDEWQQGRRGHGRVHHCLLRARRGGRVAGGFRGGLARVRNVRHGRRSD